jgi:hypothetical protein
MREKNAQCVKNAAGGGRQEEAVLWRISFFPAYGTIRVWIAGRFSIMAQIRLVTLDR